MTIRTNEVHITEGSDEGKTFVVSQMSLIAGDNWANRVALALCKSGVDLTSLNLGGDGFKGLLDYTSIFNVALKALGGIEDDTAQRLLNELLTVVKVKTPDGTLRNVIMQSSESYNPSSGRSGDITCIKTLWKLRIEAIKINLDFLTAGVTH